MKNKTLSPRARLLASMFGIFLILLTLVIGEIMVRIFRTQPTYSSLLAQTGEQYREDAVIPFTLKTNYKSLIPAKDGGDPVTISTNSMGLRNPEITLKKKKGVKRVLFLGDSFTFGVYVADNQTYPAQLQKMLTDKNLEVEIINAGYADGWSPDEHYAWLLDRGFAFEPDLVIYGFFLGNDLDGINEQLWTEKDSNNLPRRIRNPEIYVDPLGRLRSRVNDMKTVGIEKIYRIPFLRDSQLAVYAYLKTTQTLAKWFPPETPKSYGEGWGNRPWAWVQEPVSDDKMKSKEELLYQLVKGMKMESKKHNAEFAMLLFPLNFQVEKRFEKTPWGTENHARRNFFKEMKPRLKELNIKSIDMLEQMQTYPGNYFFKNWDAHFSEIGLKFVADTVYTEFKDFFEH